MSRKPLPCHHGYNPRTCNVCKAEAVRAAIDDSILRTITFTVPLGYDPRAVAIVALRRIVDRAVRVEISSVAQVDEILRIALRALNQLEE
jgi:hypothetical protein